jgi:hypothetical protein
VTRDAGGVWAAKLHALEQVLHGGVARVGQDGAGSRRDGADSLLGAPLHGMTQHVFSDQLQGRPLKNATLAVPLRQKSPCVRARSQTTEESRKRQKLSVFTISPPRQCKREPACSSEAETKYTKHR